MLQVKELLLTHPNGFHLFRKSILKISICGNYLFPSSIAGRHWFVFNKQISYDVEVPFTVTSLASSANSSAAGMRPRPIISPYKAF